MAHTHSETANNRNRLLAAFIVTALFMIIEVVGGIFSGSLALLADAGHMLTDAAALLMALLAVQFAQRKPNKQHTFGLLRLTTLAAFVNALALLIITGLIIWEALLRFNNPQPVAGKLMLYIALAGLLANLFSFWLLHHGSDDKNINVRAAALHVLGDLLGSVGAIAAAIIIMLTGWTPIDPVLSILVSLLVLRSAWGLIKESVQELLEGVPKDIDIDNLSQSLKTALPEINSVHHVHVWQIGEKPLMTLHVQATSTPDNHDILLHRINEFLHQHYHVEHATIQIEYQPCHAEQCELSHITAPHHHHH